MNESQFEQLTIKVDRVDRMLEDLTRRISSLEEKLSWVLGQESEPREPI